MSKIPTSGQKKFTIKPLRLLEESKVEPVKKLKKVIVSRRSGSFKKPEKENKKEIPLKNLQSNNTNGVVSLTRKRALADSSKVEAGPSAPPKIMRSASSRAVPLSSQPSTSKFAAKSTTVPTIKPSATTTVKIPPYDFKARFNHLKEIHTNCKTKHDDLKQEMLTMKEKLAQLESSHSTLLGENSKLKQNLKRADEKIAVLNRKCEDFDRTKQALEDAESKLSTAAQQLLNNEDLRRDLHNQVQDLKGNIRVFCRCRPLLNDENSKMGANFTYFDEQTLQLSKSESSKNDFSFDRVFPPNSTQEVVFEDLLQLIQSCLDGYNVCVFAYGQTGSGKTYTMIGENNHLEKGMIPRAVELLFEKIQDLRSLHWNYDVQLSVIEIYNETLKDLLNSKSNTSHEIRFNEGKGITVTNLTNVSVLSPSEFYSYMRQANNNRAVAATNYNEHSSRSHAITQIEIKGRNSKSNLHYSSVLYLVDLAGSENAKCSQRMDETKAINKSLANLGNVMLALQNKEKFVPYRNSKLTYLLQSALGGNSKTLMFVNVSPLQDNYNETLNSLRFASKVRKVTTKSRRCATNQQ